MRGYLILVQNPAYESASVDMATSADNRGLCYPQECFLFVNNGFSAT